MYDAGTAREELTTLVNARLNAGLDGYGVTEQRMLTELALNTGIPANKISEDIANELELGEGDGGPKLEYQYTLRHAVTGHVPTMTHQDDWETPLAGCSLRSLFQQLGDHWDMGDLDAYKEALEEGYVVVRQEVVTKPLNAEERAILAALVKADEDETEAVEAQYRRLDEDEE